MAFAVFIAIACWTLAGGWQPAAWLVAVTVVQAVEFAVAAPMRRREPVGPAQTFAFCSMVLLNAVVYSSIAAWTFFNGDETARLFAILTPAGALLHVALAMDRAPRIMRLTGTPHVLYLVGLPMADGLLSHEKNLLPHVFVALGASLFVAHILLAVRRIRQSSDELRDARDTADCERIRAEQASLAKSDFLATMSHEIRTPMNAVVASAHLLRRTDLTEAQAEHVGMLANSSEMLMGILNDVLDLAKIESGKLTVESAEFALADKLRAAVQLWNPRADEKGVTIRLEPCNLPTRMMADPLRLQQIVFNLLSNAVKFTDEGVILLRGGVARGPDRDTVWIEVEDSGCGMTPEMCDRVFASFEQGSTGVTRTHGGTGLGPSISRRLAELMGGSLTVTSREGTGSTFRLEIPFIEAEDAAPAEIAALPVADAHPPRMDILLAEDHEVNQRIVRLMLEPLGCTVTLALNGAEAVAIANQRPFDVILMDMQMPVMGGVEASSCIRLSAGPNADTPIIALTANVMDDHRAQWRAIGVDTFLGKPIDMQLLISSVCAAAAQTQAARCAA